jgi:soluble lytic murein transglycosylase-like protein
MNIDPRLMSQLLKLQMLNSSTLISGGATDSGNSSSDFSAILESILGETSAAGESLPAADQLTGSSFASPFLGINQSFSPLQSLPGKSVPKDYEALIAQAGSRFGVDTSLLKAVIDQESSFDSNAVSSAGAKGLMQLMDGTGSGLGVTDPFDPQQNVRAGTQFLSSLLKKYNGSEGTALAAYNAGPGRVDRLGIRNDQDLQQKLHLLPKETQAYVSKVLGLKQKYE